MADTFHTIILGEDRALPCQLSRIDGGSYDLTGTTEMTAEFRNADDSILSLTMTMGAIVITDAPAGRFNILITDTQSQLLKVVSPVVAQNFTIIIDKGTERRKANYVKGVKVLPEAV